MKSATKASAKIRSIFEKFSAIALTILSIVVLFTVVIVYQSAQLPNDTSYAEEIRAKNTFGNFDKKTIDKVDKLRAPNEDRALTLPSGRINPFVSQ